MNLRTLPFSLVDVFAPEPLSGNGLSVFLLDDALPTSAMQRITQEMRQFETIFLHRIGESARFNTRIFTMEEELLFAGHPIIGAAALVHAMLYAADPLAHLEFVTAERAIAATSRREGSTYSAEMDQGIVVVEVSACRMFDGLMFTITDGRSGAFRDDPLIPLLLAGWHRRSGGRPRKALLHAPAIRRGTP